MDGGLNGKTPAFPANSMPVFQGKGILRPKRELQYDDDRFRAPQDRMAASDPDFSNRYWAVTWTLITTQNFCRALVIL